MADYGIDSFLGWWRGEPGHHYAFTRPGPDDPHIFERWELTRFGLPSPDDDEWWEPGWYLSGPSTWGEFMGQLLADAQRAAKEYIAARRTPEAKEASR